MALDLDKHLGVLPDALAIRGRRTELIAKNLANADTPNYKARDVDFRDALAAASGHARGGGGCRCATTRPGHLGGASAAGGADAALQVPRAARAFARRQHRRRAGRAGRVRGERGALPGDADLPQLPVARPDDRDHRPVMLSRGHAMSSFKDLRHRRLRHERAVGAPQHDREQPRQRRQRQRRRPTASTARKHPVFQAVEPAVARPDEPVPRCASPASIESRTRRRARATSPATRSPTPTATSTRPTSTWSTRWST